MHFHFIFIYFLQFVMCCERKCQLKLPLVNNGISPHEDALAPSGTQPLNALLTQVIVCTMIIHFYI